MLVTLFRPQPVIPPAAGEVAGEVTGEVSRILRYLTKCPLSRLRTQAALKLKEQANFRERLLKENNMENNEQNNQIIIYQADV